MMTPCQRMQLVTLKVQGQPEFRAQCCPVRHSLAEEVGNLHSHTGYQSLGSDHNEAVELQAFTQEQQMANVGNIDNDALSLYDNV